jgi:hypothetical protein
MFFFCYQQIIFCTFILVYFVIPSHIEYKTQHFGLHRILKKRKCYEIKFLTCGIMFYLLPKRVYKKLFFPLLYLMTPIFFFLPQSKVIFIITYLFIILQKRLFRIFTIMCQNQLCSLYTQLGQTWFVYRPAGDLLEDFIRKSCYF